MNGHFFCSHCDDVVFPPAATAQAFTICPVCHRATMGFVRDAFDPAPSMPRRARPHRRRDEMPVNRSRAKQFLHDLAERIAAGEDVE